MYEQSSQEPAQLEEAQNLRAVIGRSPRAGVGNLRLASRMRLFLYQDAALQLLEQILITLIKK